MAHTETYETVAHVLSRQVLVPDWLRDVTAGLADDAMLRVLRQEASFGTYLLLVEPAKRCPVSDMGAEHYYVGDGVEVEWHVEGDLRYVGGVAEVCEACSEVSL